jgi:drug/metabolite transporter (DMT)-like permease
VELAGPARAGVFIHLMPIFGALLAACLLGEALHGYHGAGAALIVSRIVLTQAPVRRVSAMRPREAIASRA